MDYNQAVEFLHSFPDMERGTHGARGASMSVSSMRSLLQRLGNPQLGRHTIHVTGSKGKGSTSMMLASILNQTGFNNALFMSPHIHAYTERILFNLEPVSQEEFAQGLTEIRPHIEAERQEGGAPLSTFGILTALFFHLANKPERKVHWQVVEVGLGGRFDATNVFDNKDLAIITPISLEHTEVLGSTQAEIAANKAGIITPGCTTVLAPQKENSVKTVVARKCGEAHATFIDVGKAYKIRPLSHDLTGQVFVVDRPAGPLEVTLPLLGSHQAVNAITAIAACDALASRGVPLASRQILEGLKNIHVPGRLEILANGKQPVSSAPPYVTIVADGAHNHESAAALATALKTFFNVEQCIFVMGVNNDKNISAIWRELSGLSKLVVATKSQNPRSMDPNAICDIVNMFDEERKSATTSENVASAIEEAINVSKPGDLICVTGSLYVVAEAREYLSSRKEPSS